MFDRIEALCSLPDAFTQAPELNRLFLDAMRENFTRQYEKQSYIRFLSDKSALLPDDLKDPADVFRLPHLFVGILKVHRFCSVEDSEIVLVLTSSGTAGQKTQLLFDAPSLQRLQTLSKTVFRDLAFTSDLPAHYLIFGYDRRHAKEVGTSWSDEQIQAQAPTRSEHWLIPWDDKRGEYLFDAVQTARLLIDLAPEGPIRLLGFPAFMHQMIEEVRKLKPGLKVHPASFIVAGGGWKNHAGTPMTQIEFARYVEAAIGLPSGNVRDVFGMAEHGIPYGACSAGHHHVPAFGRLLVRDPLSLKPLPRGREGLLHLYTPYNTAQPNLSILSTDLAVLQEGCPCGLPGDYIASIRRGGTRKHKGCAIQAQEILDRSKKHEARS